jgi:hypothetical protein
VPQYRLGAAFIDLPQPDAPAVAAAVEKHNLPVAVTVFAQTCHVFPSFCENVDLLFF